MQTDFFVIATLVVGFYMAWNIGANDVANSMGTSVGSRALTLRKAVIIAGIMEFSGSVLFGKHVTETIRKGIVDPTLIGNPKILAIGAFSALLASGMWLTLSTWAKLPVSTTHSIVGGMAGFGIATIGFSEVKWHVMFKIVASWIISPIVGGIAAFIIFSLLRKFVLEKIDDLGKVERAFAYFQLLTAAYVAFAHGSNDVANAIGPVAAALSYSHGGEITTKVAIPKWLLVYGGAGIVVGLATWGYRVIETIGKRVTEITPTRGFSAEFATASVVLANSYIGMPISTTHTLVGSVIGVGFARGIKALDLKVIYRIILSWIATVPIVAIISIAIFKLIMIII